MATRQWLWDGADEVGAHGRRCHGATAHQGISCIEGLVGANRDGDSGFGTVRMHPVLARASLLFESSPGIIAGTGNPVETLRFALPAPG